MPPQETKKALRRKSLQRKAFRGVGGTGLEPVTSTMSMEPEIAETAYSAVIFANSGFRSFMKCTSSIPFRALIRACSGPTASERHLAATNVRNLTVGT